VTEIVEFLVVSAVSTCVLSLLEGASGFAGAIAGLLQAKVTICV
jgi:hypothetical protein